MLLPVSEFVASTINYITFNSNAQQIFLNLNNLIWFCFFRVMVCMLLCIWRGGGVTGLGAMFAALGICNKKPEQSSKWVTIFEQAARERTDQRSRVLIRGFSSAFFSQPIMFSNNLRHTDTRTESLPRNKSLAIHQLWRQKFVSWPVIWLSSFFELGVLMWDVHTSRAPFLFNANA